MSLRLYTLGRTERLKSRSRIDRLFAAGTGGLVYPLRYLILEEDVPVSLRETADSGVSILVSVPKRHHKRAVRRNLIKRRIREAYRLNKLPLTEKIRGKQGKTLLLAFLYISDGVADYQAIENAVRKIIAKVTTGIS